MSNLEETEQILKQAPSPKEIEKMFAEARLTCEKLLTEHSNALHIASWQGTIDGQDIVKLKCGKYSIEHLAADPMANILTWHNDLPSDQPCTVVIKPLEVRGTVYVMNQPCTENQQTITLYMEDPAPGPSVFKFEVYAVCR